ncbi:MAG: sterol carrier protein domain-containing protein [Agathobacter rectalis]
MGRIIDVAQFISQYNCDPDGPSGCFSFEIEDELLPWNNGTFVIDFEKGTVLSPTKIHSIT